MYVFEIILYFEYRDLSPLLRQYSKTERALLNIQIIVLIGYDPCNKDFALYYIIRIMCSRCFQRLFSYHQPHMLHGFAMLVASGDDIDPRGVDAAVTENVGELGNVLFNAAKRAGKQVAKIVRKDLVRIDVGVFAQLFHLPPDVRAADRFAAARHEDWSCCDMLLFGILQQFLFERFDKKDRANFSLAVDGRLTALDHFNRDELQFAYADASTADRLNDEVQAVVFFASRRSADGSIHPSSVPCPRCKKFAAVA